MKLSLRPTAYALPDNNNLHNQHHNASRQTHTHTLTYWSHKKGGWLSGKELLSNVKNKISTRIGKQNNLINEITFLEDVLARGEIHF